MASAGLLVAGGLLLGLVVILGLSGIGVYPPIPITPVPNTTTSTGQMTVTTSSTMSTGSSIYVSTASAGQTLYLNGEPYACSGAHYCAPVPMIFNQPGPITSADQYCSYYMVYYGVSNCPISAGGSSNAYNQNPQQSVIGQPSQTYLVNFSLVASSWPFVDVRLVVAGLLGLFLLVLSEKRKR